MSVIEARTGYVKKNGNTVEKVRTNFLRTYNLRPEEEYAIGADAWIR